MNARKQVYTHMRLNISNFLYIYVYNVCFDVNASNKMLANIYLLKSDI